MEQMLELSALMDNRVAFEHWSRELRAADDQLPMVARVDFELALGNGYRHFGQPGKAKRHLQSALRLAEENGLNQLLFKAEELLKELNHTPEEARPTAAEASSREWDAHVSAVAGKVHALRCA